MLTVEEMKEAVLSYFIGPNATPDYAVDMSEYDEDYTPTFSDLWEEYINETMYSDGFTLHDGTIVKKVAEFGGEGDGDTLWVVFSVGDQLFRMDGYYASWVGSNWDDAEPYEVEPVIVQVTKYQKKKVK